MEQIKELTKRLIANSFKELMLKYPFEKITIKTITDNANIIRPTFYNHFHDKYELVEWIVRTEIVEEVTKELKETSSKSALQALFGKFLEDKEYYKRAFEIGGQNGFSEVITDLLTEMFANVISDDLLKEHPYLEKDVVARYYATGAVAVVRYEVFRPDTETVEEISSAYKYLMQHTIFDFVPPRKV